MRSRSKAQPLARPRVSRRVSGAHFQTLSAAVRAVSGAHFQILSDVAPWLGGGGAERSTDVSWAAMANGKAVWTLRAGVLRVFIDLRWDGPMRLKSNPASHPHTIDTHPSAHPSIHPPIGHAFIHPSAYPPSIVHLDPPSHHSESVHPIQCHDLPSYSRLI